MRVRWCAACAVRWRGGGALFLAVLWGFCTDANAAQVFVSPRVGQVGVFVWGKGANGAGGTKGTNRTDILAFTPTLGLSVGVSAENGFTFITQLDAGLSTLLFRAQFLLGWALRMGEWAFFLPSTGVDIMSTKDKIVGVPVNLDFHFFFTRVVGLSVGVASGVGIPITANLEQCKNGAGSTDLKWEQFLQKYCLECPLTVQMGPVFRV